MIKEIYKNLNGDECVIVENEDGTISSMLKAAWDELEANKENGTIS